MLYRVFVFPQFLWALGFRFSFLPGFLGKSSCSMIWKNGWMDGWMDRSAVVGNTRNCTMQYKYTVTARWKWVERMKEGGAVVGNECEFAILQNKTTVTGWLASPGAATIVVVETDGARERKKEL
ncbi:hypothetical protein B9Z19DRAFT_472244 [Tuber borchii]|uniref:Uncharacterized protein n=1 Tax=Tuber borchii TaxID=42251 RepID=A0A2T6ZFE0_TUBBO|nr:hypothetical protein B9Z19DRAFT_472244 [Tuber borchii]